MYKITDKNGRTVWSGNDMLRAMGALVILQLGDPKDEHQYRGSW